MSTSIQKNKPYRVIGTTPIRHDGYEKVTGKAKYGADIDLPGMLYGKILRSPHAHAKIVSINTKKAESIPGVKAIATANDFPLLSNSGIDFSGFVFFQSMYSFKYSAFCSFVNRLYDTSLDFFFFFGDFLASFNLDPSFNVAASFFLMSGLIHF